MRRVTLISTGGTIEKTYDEASGALSNRASIVPRMLRRLRLEETQVNSVQLMHKDSLDLTDDDRRRIVEAVRLHADGAERGDGVVVLHGTDTLCETGDLLARELSAIKIPVILTGAMRPYEMARSDALQNLTEAILASGVVEAGVYVAAHGRVMRFPGVKKDRVRGTFVPV
ncbi:MAG: asparaginase [Phycisphaerales bacterium]